MRLAENLDRLGDAVRRIVGGLAPRERVLVGFTALVVLCFIGYFAKGAMDASKKQLTTNITLATQAQTQVDELLLTYADLTGTAQTLNARLEAGRDFAPLTWIESTGNEMGIQANIRSVNERGTEATDYYVAQTIDVVINDLDLRQTVDLLYRFETAPQAVRIRDLRIKADRKERSQLDLRMELAILKPLEES
ncbi:MAG: hypothetical protein VX498_07705 [Myxococcota bacterium]|nr:hypothetical protein [Myxococcota bacterium]